MPILIGLVGIVALAFLWIRRARTAAHVTRDIVGAASEVSAAARRLGFRRRASIHPVDSVEEPDIAIASLAVAFLELAGLPCAEDQETALLALQKHTGHTARSAEEGMILGRWLVHECGGPLPAVSRLSRRLTRLDRTGTLTPLMAVLNEIARATRGGISDRQRDALAEIARHFRLT